MIVLNKFKFKRICRYVFDVIVIVSIVCLTLFESYKYREYEKNKNDISEIRKDVKSISNELDKHSTELSGDYEYLSELDRKGNNANDRINSLEDRVKNVENN